MIDSHCHLADEAFAGDLHAVVERARAAGLSGALCILSAGDAAEERRADAVRAAWPAVRFAAGVHPHRAGDYAGRPGAAVAAVAEARTRVPGLCAVGEIGLDYHYDFAPRDVQRAVFAEQLEAAREWGLPVVIHTREADDDTFDLLATVGQGVRGVFHCFTGGVDRARRALDLDFHISLSGIVTFPKATDLHEVAAYVPADRLLIETDSPYLAPVPYRGRRNEPAWVARVAEAIAARRGVEPAQVAEGTTRAFLQLFGP
ncbi:MAG TPA: TatD family hydrolase [Vicinamibacterales bacterium]